MSTSKASLNRRQFLKGTASLGAALALPFLRPRASASQALPADITSMSASRLSDAIRDRQVSCVEVMRAYLESIHRYNPVYNAVVSMVDDDELHDDRPRAADRALDAGEYWGWMHGMPHAVKDLANAKGLETSYGSRIFAGTIAEEDDLHIARIRAQGAIFIGKTNTPEFGLGSQSYNDVHGTTRNAYDPSLTAGGSSGGAACGMATHMLPIADGSDMMGSLRNPAGFNNVIGFRPSQGRVPGVPSNDLFYQQLSTDGPMGRNVEDTDPPSRNDGWLRFPRAAESAETRFPRTRRSGVGSGRVPHRMDGRLRRATWRRSRVCWSSASAPSRRSRDTGRSSRTVCQPTTWRGSGKRGSRCVTGRRTARSRSTTIPRSESLLKPEIVWEIEGSFGMPASQIAEAGVARADWYRALLALFERYDILALPTAQVFPVPGRRSLAEVDRRAGHGHLSSMDGGRHRRHPRRTYPSSICRPGSIRSGRPMGMQFLGRMGEDRAVLEFAMAYEAVTSYLDRRPSLKESL